MSAITKTPEADIYRYGWRDVTTKLPNGKERTRRIPLTIKDCLYPEEGDCMPQSSDHEAIITYLVGVLRRRLADDSGALVLADCKFYWGLSKKGNHSPDIAVTFGVRNPDRDFRSFKAAKEGVRPTVIIEVVSPDVRDNDVVAKVKDYHHLAIPWYVIVDQKEEDGPRTLVAYRYAPTGYVPVEPDENGWVWIDPLDLWLEVGDRSVVCYDGATRKPIPGVTELADLAERERERAQRERARAKRERARAKRERVSVNAGSPGNVAI